MSNIDDKFAIGLLTPGIRSRAISLEPNGVDEFAFPLEDAVEICNVASRAGMKILGGDLWSANSGGWLTAAGWNWDAPATNAVGDLVASLKDFLDQLDEKGGLLISFVWQLP